MPKNKFIQPSIKHPGRTRRLLKLQKGEKVTQRALNKKIASVKKTKPAGAARKSELGALQLGKRLIKPKTELGGLRKSKSKKK